MCERDNSRIMFNAQYTRRRIRASHETPVSFLETLPGALFFIDNSETIIYANASAQALTGARPEQTIGRPLAQTLRWSDSSIDYEQFRAALAQASRGETVRFEAIIHLQDGRDLDLAATITPHIDPDNRIAYYLIYVTTTGTARQQAEDEFCGLIDDIPQLVWSGRPDGDIDYHNQRWYDYTGLPAEQVQRERESQCLHPDERAHVLALWQSAVQEGRPYEAELRLRQGTTGDYRWFLVRATPLRDAQGTILKYVGTCTDIDERKRVEQQLKASEQSWRMLAEAVPQLVWTARANGLVDYFNQRLCDYTQASEEQLSDDGWSQFLHPDDYERTLAVWRYSCASGESYEIEYRLRDGKTGSYRWFLARGMPVRDDSGQIVKWLGTCTDIDEQKRMMEALQQSQARIRTLIDSNLIGIVSVEGDEEVIVEANEAWLRMAGYTREDVDSKTLTRARFTPPEDAHLFEHALQELATGEQTTPFETEFVCKDGSRLPILVGGVLFQDHPRQIVAFALDNSARKELEQRKDDFIGMASHELRNPLTALKLQMTLLHRQLARQGIQASAPALSSMEIQINKVTRLVEELLDVSKIQAGSLEYRQEMVDLDALLRESINTMQQIHPGHCIQVRGAVQTSLIGDRDRLGEVFTNLLSNAIKYSPNAQTVEIDLASSEDAATIRVHDHGLGIPQEQRDKIFERFYRLASSKQKAIPGLGVGLYIAAEVVKHHRGTIMVDSVVGKGSTFTVTFPFKKPGQD